MKSKNQTSSFIDVTDAIQEIESLLKDNHILILGDISLLSTIEHKIYMNDNNDDFKLFSGGFSVPKNRMITTMAVVKKNKELRDLLGMDDDKKWKYLLCVCQNKIEGFHMLKLDGVYEIPKWGKTKSIRSMLNCIFTTLDLSEDTARMGFPFEWKNLPLLYCFEDDYQEYWFNKGKNKKPKRKRTHVPKGLRHEVFKRDNYTCVECGAKKSDGATLHVDHIIPVSKGGSDELDNLQTLCSECNLNKSDLIQNDK